MTQLNDFPAAEGRIVTQGHEDICTERGHATWTEDGEDKDVCPRCGAVTETTQVEKCDNPDTEHPGFPCGHPPVIDDEHELTIVAKTPDRYRMTRTEPYRMSHHLKTALAHVTVENGDQTGYELVRHAITGQEIPMPVNDLDRWHASIGAGYGLWALIDEYDLHKLAARDVNTHEFHASHGFRPELDHSGTWVFRVCELDGWGVPEPTTRTHEVSGTYRDAVLALPKGHYRLES